MAKQKSDIELKIKTVVDGMQDITRLVSEIDALGGESGDAATEAAAFNRELESLQKQQGAIDAFNKLNKKINAVSKSLEKTKSDATRLGSGLADAKKSVDRLGGALDKSEQQLSDSSSATRRLKKEVAGAAVAYNKQSKSLASLETQQQKAQARVSELATAIAGSEKQNRRLTNSYALNAKKLAELNEKTAAQRVVVRSAKEAHDALNKSLKKSAEELGRAEKGVSKLKQELKKAKAPISAISKEFEVSRQRAVRLKTEHLALAGSLSAVRNKAKAAGVDTKRLTAEQVRLAGASASLNKKTAALANKLASTRDAYRASAKNAKNLNKELDESARKSGRAAKGMGLLKRAVGAVGAAMAARLFVDTNKKLESMRLGFETVAGSSAAAAEEMAYVERVADRMGTSILVSADAYLSLTAASKGSALEGADTRGIYEAVSLAMGKLGRSTSQTEGALRAIEQMMSKGKVQAEELRGQLGERLPGAFNLAADAMGITTAELDKLLETGKVTAEEMLPKLTVQLNKLYDDGGKIDTFAAGWERWKNGLTGLSGQVDESSGAMDSMGDVMSDLAGYLKEMIVGVKGSSQEWRESVDFIASSTKVAFGAVKITWNTTQIAFKSLVLVINEGIQKINEGLALITWGDISKEFSHAATEIADENRKMRLSIGEDVADIVDAGKRMVGAFSDSKDAVKEVSGEVKDFGAVSEETVSSIDRLAVVLKGVGINAKELGTGFSEHATKQIIALTAVLHDSTLKGAALIDFFVQLRSSADSPVVVASAMGILEAKFNAGKISASEYKDELAALKERKNELEGATLSLAAGAEDLRGQLFELGASYRNNKITASEFLEQTTKLTDQLKDQRDTSGELSDATEQAGDAAADQTVKYQQVSGAVEAMITTMGAARSMVGELGAKATASFESMVEAINKSGAGLRDFTNIASSGAGEVDGYRAEVQALTRQMETLDDVQRFATGGATKWMAAVSKAAVTVKREFLEQKIAATQLGDRLESLTGASEEQLDSIERTVNGYGLLDDSDLSNVRSEVSRLRSEQEALNDSISSTLRNLQDESDRLSGNQAAIERRDYVKRVEELREQLDLARRSGNESAVAEAMQALQILERLHQSKMQQIRSDGGGGSSSLTPSNRSPGRGGGLSSNEYAGSGGGGGGGALTTTIRFESPSGKVVAGRFAAQDEPDLLDIIKEAGGRSS